MNGYKSRFYTFRAFFILKSNDGRILEEERNMFKKNV